MAGSTIQAHSNFDNVPGQKERLALEGALGAAPDELIVSAANNSKGYQLLRAMGFKDRGHSKFCFKSYEHEEDDGFSSDEDFNQDELERLGEGSILPLKRTFPSE